MEKLVKSLDQRGLMVRFQTNSLEEARDLQIAVKEWGTSAARPGSLAADSVL
jgi:hypothetical protein